MCETYVAYGNVIIECVHVVCTVSHDFLTLATPPRGMENVCTCNFKTAIFWKEVYQKNMNF